MKNPEIVCDYSSFKTEEKMEFSAEVITSTAKCFLPEIMNFFESEEGKKEFAEWKADREKR